jgi:hypothetical protein
MVRRIPVACMHFVPVVSFLKYTLVKTFNPEEIT